MYVVNHCTLTLHWVDLASARVAALSSENVLRYHTLCLFLLQERAMREGAADFVGKISDGVHTTVLRLFYRDHDLVARAQTFHRALMDRHNRGV